MLRCCSFIAIDLALTFISYTWSAATDELLAPAILLTVNVLQYEEEEEVAE